MQPADVIIPIVLMSVVAFGVTRRTSDSFVHGFCDLYEVTPDAGDVGELRAWMTRSRRFRAAGAVIALAVLLATGGGGLWSGLSAGAIGFAIGSLADELTRRFESDATSTVASLETRSWRTHVERWVMALAAIGVVSLIGQSAIAWHLNNVAQTTALQNGAVAPRRLLIVAALVVGLATAVGGIGLVNRIARLPVRPATPSRQALRHGLRTMAALSIVGAVLLALGFTTGVLAARNAVADSALHASLQWATNLTFLVVAISIVTGIAISLNGLPRGRDRGRMPAVPEAAT